MRAARLTRRFIKLIITVMFMLRSKNMSKVAEKGNRVKNNVRYLTKINKYVRAIKKYKKKTKDVKGQKSHIN